MSFDLWLTYIAAFAILSIIPGPSVLLVVGQALTRGTTAAFMCILGNLLAGVVLMVLSLMGVGAILAASITLFVMLKWAGVFYMAYLGYCQIKDARNPDAIEQPALAKNSLKAGFLAGILNPKSIIFYMAFLTQFMDPNGDQLLQFAVMICTSTVVITLVLTGYVLMAARARKAFQSGKARKAFGYTGGGFLLGGSVMMAVAR